MANFSSKVSAGAEPCDGEMASHIMDVSRFPTKLSKFASFRMRNLADRDRGGRVK